MAPNAGPVRVDPTLHMPIADPDDWAATPAVDPWEGQETPWLPAAAAGAPPPTSTPPPPGPPVAPGGAHQPSRTPAPAPGAAHRPAPGLGGPHQPPPAPRRRRRWPRNLLVLTVFSVACCCGVPAYYAWPAAHQYPATAVLPATVADLELRDDRASRRAAERLTQKLLDVNLVADDVFAGVYRDGNGKRVTLSGMTGLRLTPQADLEAEMQRLTAEYDIARIEEFDLDETGAHQRCGVGRADGASVVVCGWADHGSLVTVLLTRRSVSDSAALVAHLRQSVLTRA